MIFIAKIIISLLENERSGAEIAMFPLMNDLYVMPDQQSRVCC